MTASFETVFEALRHSHERLSETLRDLTPEQLDSASYDDEWTIADVAGHLGSGAEVNQLFLTAGLDGGPPPGLEQFEPIWAVWDAKLTTAKATDVLAADRALQDRLAALSRKQRDGFTLELFGAVRDLP